MRVRFKIRETVQEVLSSLTANDIFDIRFTGGSNIDLVDKDHRSSICSITNYGTCLVVTTAWSEFQYFIYDHEVEYYGAYRGLCEQNLLPTFTPIISGDEMVSSSLSDRKMTLRDYVKLQDEFDKWRYKHTIKSCSGHPKVVKHLL